MKFEILERDGLARRGRLEIDGASFETPVMAFVDTERHPAPRKALRIRTEDRASKGDIKVARSEFVNLDGHRMAEGMLYPGWRGSPFADDVPSGDITVLPKTAAMLLDSKLFSEQLAELKSGPGLLKPLYCPVMGLPHRLAFLAYCGFDIFESTPLIMAAMNGSYLTPSGILAYDHLSDLPCPCPACASGRRGTPELLEHNYAVAESELRLVRHLIAEGRLRELVEARVRSEPWLVQNLRLLDIEHHDLQEMHAPVKGAPFHAGSKESLQRPDVVRWRRRLQHRYRRPTSATVLLLIPCSAKKPYSASQSHVRFRQVLRDSGRIGVVHEVIVTSPLGLVPRELEMFYPAKDYDIPVTGHWDRDERSIVEEMVTWLVESQRYELVISHLGDEREAVNSVLRDFVDTSDGSPGSRQSLDRLREALITQIPEPRGSGKRLEDDLKSICRFQFGEAGERLCEGVRACGRWPNVRLMSDHEQIGMLTGERGMVSLTLAGAKRLAPTGAYCVEIEDFEPKGNLFAVGVEGCSPEVRIGDDVAVVHKGDVRAVGVARMCAAEMVVAERGEAVHIRHVR
ncbi:MAG: archaeosine synthase subunit alpha [Thermoplasmata archaeon]